MRACFVIDRLSGLHPSKDSSLDMMLEAQRRGHECWFIEGLRLSAGSEGVFGYAARIEVADDARAHKSFDPDLFEVGEADWTDLSRFDAIFIRKDPPFDEGYLSLTLMLEPLQGGPQFVNSPRGVRTVSEKLSALLFSQAVPETLATYDLEQAYDFAGRFDKVVLKPSYFGSGKGVFVSSAADEAFDKNFNVVLKTKPFGPVILQEFLPEVYDGDTRVMMVDGQVVGALGRKPAAGEFRANIAVGGKEFLANLTQEQVRIAQEVGAFVKGQGIVFAGLDFIGDKLIEINVTSPTLIQELRRVGGPDVSRLVWDHIEAHA